MTQLLSPELQSRIELLRAKSLTAGGLTLEEQKEAIRWLRADRMAAAERGRTAKARTTKAPARSATELLGALGVKPGGTQS